MRAGVLVVDGANVVGSVPDGWWRDRAGAARRLHAELLATESGWERVVLVLEGAARAGVEAGEAGSVRTVHAPGSGDDELVEQCRRLVDAGETVTAATADRGLIGRLRVLGVAVIGPRAVRSGE